MIVASVIIPSRSNQLELHIYPPWSVVAVMDDVLLIDVGWDRLQELETIVIIRS